MQERDYQASSSSTTEEWERTGCDSIPVDRDDRHKVTSKLDGATTLIDGATLARVAQIAAETTIRRRKRTGERAEVSLYVAAGGLWLEGVLRAQARYQDTFTSTRTLARYHGLIAKKGGTWRIYEYAGWMHEQKLLSHDRVILDDDRERYSWILTRMPREHEVRLVARTEHARQALPALWLPLPIDAFFSKSKLKPIDLYVLATITEVAMLIQARDYALPGKILPPLATLGRDEVTAARNLTYLGRDLWYASVDRLAGRGYVRRQQHGRLALMPVRDRKTIFELTSR